MVSKEVKIDNANTVFSIKISLKYEKNLQEEKLKTFNITRITL